MHATVQELEVWYILPAVRKDLAKIMKERGLSQAKIAKLLGITEAAISQYLKSKRASDTKFDERMKPELERAATNIIAGKNQRSEIQKIIKYLEKNHVVCKVCKDNRHGTCMECYR